MKSEFHFEWTRCIHANASYKTYLFTCGEHLHSRTLLARLASFCTETASKLQCGRATLVAMVMQRNSNEGLLLRGELRVQSIPSATNNLLEFLRLKSTRSLWFGVLYTFVSCRRFHCPCALCLSGGRYFPAMVQPRHEDRSTNACWRPAISRQSFRTGATGKGHCKLQN